MSTNTDTEGVGQVPTCAQCGSQNVVIAALAYFNPEFGLWELEATLEQAHCRNCDAPKDLVWKSLEVPPNQRIRELNDRFRMHGKGRGSVFVTQGVQALGHDTLVLVVEAVRTFTDFSEDNDPWGEHDFGAVEVCGEKIFFKLDYYDPTLTKGSENPANEGQTHRVLTVMLAREY